MRRQRSATKSRSSDTSMYLHRRDGLPRLMRNTEHALRAFEQGVIDFVAKPFTKQRLEEALRRVIEPGGRSPHAARFLAVRKQSRIELVAVDDVLYVQGADDFSELVLMDGRRELHDKTLEKLQALLPP